MILQDALLLFVEKHARIPPGSWRAWIFGTLHNRRRELFKKRALWRKYEPLLEAHVQQAGAWNAEPDAAVRQQQVLFALVWLLEQVEPCRREVAERYLFDAMSLAAIAAETGLPLGTVRSRWERAKGDMRAALEHKRAKLDDVFVAIMLAILGACCLWIVALVRRTAGDLAAALGRPPHRFTVRGRARTRGERPSIPRAARQAATSRRRRKRIVPTLACALLPLALLCHAPTDVLEPSGIAIAAASFEASAGTITRDAQVGSDTARDETPVVPAPVPAVHVERPRRQSAPPAVLRAVRTVGTSGRSEQAEQAPPPVERERELGRALLDRANTALHQGHEAIARDALQLYDEDFHDNPFPALRAHVAAGLKARRQP